MKKLLALLLCLAMVATVFAACGDGSGSQSSSAPQSSQTGDSAPESSAAGGEESSEAGEPSGEAVNGTNPGNVLPIVTEPVTLTIAKERHMLDTTKSYNEKASFKNITEETGLTLEFVELAAGTAAEKVPLMLAGGDMPDVFWALLSDAQILQNTTQLVPLEGMLEDFAPNSLKTYEELGTDWRTIAIAPDDHMYGMLSRYESLYENTGDGIQIINKKWLEAVNKEVPTTLDEYYEVLKAFKEQDPNGNGQADEIPYCFAEDMWCASITNDIGMWGIGNGYGDTNSNFHIRDGKVSGTVNTPEYREYLEFFHKLYAEGLIDAEGFSQNTEVFSNKIKNNQVGTYYSWTALEYLSSEQEKDWVVLPTIAAKEGVQPVANGEIDRSTINKNGWVITTQCDHPEAALRLWDYLARDAESKMTVAMGEKGTLWDEYPEGGYYFVVPENTTPEYTFEHMKYTLGTVNNHPLVTKAETPKNNGEISPAAALRDQMVAAVDKDYVPKSGQLPQSYVSPEAIDERAFIETDLKSYIKQFRSQAIMDGFDDAAWDAYCKRLDDLQYPAWLQWYQDFMDGNL
ncbi:extracellular solute-binding protein [Acutalibacter sp.]|jgi:putative aldouronate transport system substrate-binding protein|uniref:extracellular solute-binding protein n=1 Tax=Acutalibacter sp. TaxID=1918636 RepID=UPI002170B2C5|nr:extracellular solute-binding protein [Acutalibacter sp.]